VSAGACRVGHARSQQEHPEGALVWSRWLRPDHGTIQLGLPRRYGRLQAAGDLLRARDNPGDGTTWADARKLLLTSMVG
jgi:hypothetical protein